MWMDFLLYIGKFLLMTALSEALRPKNKSRNPAGGLKDLDFPTVDPTRPVQWLIGKRLIDNPNVFATFDFKGVERFKKVKSGLFSSDQMPLPPEYYVSAGMVLCGGAGARLREVWVGDRLAWTGNVASGAAVPLNVSWTEDGQEDAPRGIRGVLEFYSGSTTPSAYLEAKRGVGNVPSWRHLTYVVLRGADGAGAWIGTNRQVEQLKCVVERMPTAASTGLGEPADGGSYWANGEDANPSYAAAEVMTDVHYGAGIDPDLLDKESFHQAAKVLHAENHGTSQLWDSQRVSGDVVLELCRQTGMVIVPNPVTALQTLRVLRAADEPVMVLDKSNIQSIDAFERTAMDEQVNLVAVQYTDREQKYKQFPAEAADRAAIEVAGQVIPSTQSYAGLMNASIAGVIAMRDLRAISAPLATARVTAIVAKRQRFMPGDAVLFTSEKHGVVSLRMRVTSARYSRPGEALCELELVEDVFRSGEAVYSTPAPVGSGSGGFAVPSPVIGGTQDLIAAPYALTGEDADRALYYAFAPDAKTTGYDAAWSNAEPSMGDLYGGSSLTPEYHPRRNVGFAAKGTLAAALGDITAPASIVINLTPADAGTLRRFGSQAVYVHVEREVLQATGVSVNGAGTQATLTGLTRGLWDTVPVAVAAGGTVVVLCDYAIDVAPLRTEVKTDTGQLAVLLDGQTSLCAWAYGRNGRGISGAGPAVSYSALNDWVSSSTPPGPVRASLPYTPGAVKLAGVHGSSTQAGAPNVAATSGTLTATWTPRNRKSGGLGAWSGTNGTSEADTFTTVQLQRWNGAFWTVASTSTVSGPTTSAALAAPTGTLPMPLRLVVFSYRTVAGVTGGITGRSQTWYFNRTT